MLLERSPKLRSKIVEEVPLGELDRLYSAFPQCPISPQDIEPHSLVNLKF